MKKNDRLFRRFTPPERRPTTVVVGSMVIGSALIILGLLPAIRRYLRIKRM